MKIAVIGEGIIGYFIASYLGDKKYDVDCISPNINECNSYKKVGSSLINNLSDTKIISPKLKRKDLERIRNETEKIFKKECLNFEGLELANKMGLAKFWGANLAYEGLAKDIKALKLSKKEWDYIKKKIPFMDVQNFYKKRFNWDKQNKFLSKQKFLKSSILAVFESEIKDTQLPGFKYSKEIFGNSTIKNTSFNRINGRVLKIQANEKSQNKFCNLLIETENNILSKKYDYVVVAAGAIGSFRLVMDSFKLNPNNNLFHKINHHHILSTLFFLPKIPYPRKYIGMSNLDLSTDSENINLYLNFFPFRSLIDIYKFQLIESKKSLINKIKLNLLILIENLLEKFFLTKWFFHRLYITNIYLPSEMTSSYIGVKNNKITLIGGLRSDFEKLILKRLFKKLVKQLTKHSIYNLLIKPQSISIGADLHYASSLSNYLKKDGTFKLKSIPRNIIIADSSSSEYLPIANPTLFFIARGIKLVRKIKVNKKNHMAENNNKK